jgi:L-fuconolactonase
MHREVAKHLDEVIDAHVHLWDLASRPQPWIEPVSMASIHRTFGNDDLDEIAVTAGIAGVVLIQTSNDRVETIDYLENASRNPLIRGVVGWVDIGRPDLSDQIAELRTAQGGALLVGLRHQAQAEPDPAAWIRGAAVRDGIATVAQHDLVFDLMFRADQLRAVHELVRSLSEVRFVLDHAGKPPVRQGWRSDEARLWAALVAEIAAHPNVTCKLSGLTTMADHRGWTVDDLRPYVDHVHDAFGADRVMFGSDWPVSLQAGTYVRTLDAMQQLLAGLDERERYAIMAGTAKRVYRLADTSTADRTRADRQVRER